MAGDGADDGNARPGTAEMSAPPREGAPVDKGAVPKTVVDPNDAEATRKDDAPPWAAPGKTQPGEPPLMDVAMAQPAFPAPQRAPVPVAAPPPVAPMPMVPRYPPAIAPAPPRGGGGGSSLGLVIGGLVGLAAVIALIAAFVVFKPAKEEDAPLQPLGGGATPTEVKPSVPAGEVTATETAAPVAETPSDPLPAASPKPKPTYTSKPKPTATTQPTAQPTATSQPTATTQPTLPPPPPPNTGTGSGGTGGKPRLKLPKPPGG